MYNLDFLASHNIISENLFKILNEYSTYLEVYKNQSEKTTKAYLIETKDFLLFLHKQLDSIIDCDNLNSLNAIFFKKYIVQISDNISNRSINRCISALKSFFNFLLDNNFINLCYIDKINVPKFEKNIVKPVNKNSLIELLEYIEFFYEDEFVNKRNKALFYLIYSSGLRISEAINLNVGDVLNANDGFLIIMGKGSKQRIVPLLDNVKIIILDYIKLLKNKNLKSPLFLGVRGKRFSPTIAQKQLSSVNDINMNIHFLL